MTPQGGVEPTPPHAEFAALLALWEEARGPRPLPLWRAFRPERIPPPLFGRLFVVEVAAEAPPVFRYGLIGEEIVATFGRRATGRLVGQELFSDEAEAAIAFHVDILRRRRPCIGQGYATWTRGRIPYEDLYLPFARHDDGGVAVIAGAMRFLGRRPTAETASVNDVSWQQVTWF